MYSEIQKLKKEKNAILLVHNYQIPEIQDLGDFVGDSLALAQAAVKTTAKVIIFCGVDFMAESTKILNPEKKVIHLSRNAKCPMAAMINVNNLKKLKQENPEAAVVAYVNTTAETKALTDICCTSANAVKVVKNLPNKKIIFVPDKNLGYYVKKLVPEKDYIFSEGYCYVHEHLIKKEILLMLKKKHPNADILVHPECTPEVIEIADFILSTEGMIKHVKNSTGNEFIIGTEKELCYRLKKENPAKMFYYVNNAICEDMKKITLQNVLDSLRTLEPEIQLQNNIIENAIKPLKRMMEFC